ncbi:hypothetical protein O181_066199 [Austropuccinia psidii MF-1]|uniref:Uncharacterized protein n=1 Tax=Austropuccinia psidii MF-1 TaxID=1389203 RepID=A0A9Q3ESJ7_9BASI|nr:hypothetical protein [Austropuccinia psidii MF-1]
MPGCMSVIIKMIGTPGTLFLNLPKNKSHHLSTKQSPFLTVYGRDPHSESVHITQNTPAGMLSTKNESVKQDVKRELEVSIDRFKRYADKTRASPLFFNHGDMVWISSKNIKSTRSPKKLSEIWPNTFPILEKVPSHTYHINGNPSTQYSIFLSLNQ